MTNIDKITSSSDPHAVVRYTCFCIPARTALLATALPLLLLSVAYVTIGWIVANKLNSQMSDLQRIVSIFHVFIYIVLGAFLLVGIYGVVVRRSRQVSLVAPFIVGQLLFGIASGVLCLYLLFQPEALSDNTGTGTDKCTALLLLNPDDSLVQQLCNGSAVVKGLCLSFFILTCILELATAYVSLQYLAQLRLEETKWEMQDQDSFC